MPAFQVEGRNVLIAGGSKGLGLSFATQLAAKGANITIVARSIEPLELAKKKIEFARKSSHQLVDIISVDLCDFKKVDEALRQHRAPDILICTAGGASSQVGYLADLEPDQIRQCMENNYISTAFIAQSVLKLWIQLPASKPSTTRHMVFTSSTAAFVALPGYDAYSPTKAAVRSLADTLRQELLLYGGPNEYQVHCCFPGNFVSDGFVQEQRTKPELTKILEKTEESAIPKLPSADVVARSFISSLEAGQRYVTFDFEGRLLLNSMRGMSPRDGLFALDWVLTNVGNTLLWLVQRKFDRITRQKGLENQK